MLISRLKHKIDGHSSSASLIGLLWAWTHSCECRGSIRGGVYCSDSVRLFSGIEPEMLDVGNQRLAQCANERTQWQDDVLNGSFIEKQTHR